ncbi:ester cyclase [Frigoribacterium sp. 2-23]|uniref:ester cyclase n=1 Tax=Frigoribacterium sp. 2-23 TaxID=3415006 RepID=UPI003C6EAB4B
MSKDKNLATQQLLGEILTARAVDRLGEGFHADVVDHDPVPGAPAGVEGIKAFWSDFFTAFPDVDLAVETLVADDDHVTAVFTISGTHTGPFQGHEPTGKSFTVRGIQVGRFDDDGLLVERWGATDEAGLQQQLGLS